MGNVVVLVTRRADRPVAPVAIAFARDVLERLSPLPAVVLSEWRSNGDRVVVLAADPAPSCRSPRETAALTADGDGVIAEVGWLVLPGRPAADRVTVHRARHAGGAAQPVGVGLSVCIGFDGAGSAVAHGGGGVVLHHAESADVHILSDRSVVAAAILGGRFDPEPDLRHLAALIGTGVGAWGSRSAFAGVTRVETTAEVRFKPGSLAIVPAKTDVLLDGDLAARLGREPDAVMDELHDLLVETLRAVIARGDPGGARLWLSGGFDSRLVLALMTAAGLVPEIAAVDVMGDATSADRRVAAVVAAASGLPLTLYPERILPRRLDEDLSTHLFLGGGEVGPWDLAIPLAPRGSLRLSGVEVGLQPVLRRCSASRDGFLRQLARWTNGFDQLDVLTPDAREAVAAIPAAFAASVDNAVVSRGDLAFRFMLAEHGRSWTAPVLAADAVNGQPIAPLLIDSVNRIAANLDAVSRDRLEIHAALIARASPALDRLPYAKRPAPWRDPADPPPIGDLGADGPLHGIRAAVVARWPDVLDRVMAAAEGPLRSILDPRAVTALGDRRIDLRGWRSLLSLLHAGLLAGRPAFDRLSPFAPGRALPSAFGSTDGPGGEETVTLSATRLDGLLAAEIRLRHYEAALLSPSSDKEIQP